MSGLPSSPPAPRKSAATRQHGWRSLLKISLPTLALLGAFALYGLYWSSLAHEARRGIERWFAQERARGYEANYGALTMSGFPLRMTARLDNVRFGRLHPVSGWSWQTQTVYVDALPYSLAHIILRFPTRHELRWHPGVLDAAFAPEERRLELSASKMQASVHVREGHLERFSLAVENIQAQSPAPRHSLFGPSILAFSIGDVQAHAREEAGQAGATNTALAVLVDRFNWGGGEAAHGAQLASLKFSGRLMRFSHQDPLFTDEAPLPDALKAWAAKGGAIGVEALDLHWGELTIKSAGNLALGTDGRLSGRLEAEILGQQGLVQAMVQAGRMTPNEGQVITGLVDVLGRSDKNADAGAHFAFKLRRGELMLGPALLLTLPPLF